MVGGKYSFNSTRNLIFEYSKYRYLFLSNLLHYCITFDNPRNTHCNFRRFTHLNLHPRTAANFIISNIEEGFFSGSQLLKKPFLSGDLHCYVSNGWLQLYPVDTSYFFFASELNRLWVRTHVKPLCRYIEQGHVEREGERGGIAVSSVYCVSHKSVWEMSGGFMRSRLGGNTMMSNT